MSGPFSSGYSAGFGAPQAGVPGHPLPYSQTIILVRRELSGQDEYSNDVYTDTEHSLDYCVVQPSSSSEVTQWTEQVSTDITVFVPYGTVVTALDALLIDGIKYEIQGDPQSWRSPFSGNTSPMQIRAAVVTGVTV
jgi:hypothetical protein